MILDTQSNQLTAREVNYYWKKFDFTNGRTYNQILNEHQYSKDPVASMSKRLARNLFRPNVPVIPPRRHLLLHQ
jgi:hypothetical protein